MVLYTKCGCPILTTTQREAFDIAAGYNSWPFLRALRSMRDVQEQDGINEQDLDVE